MEAWSQPSPPCVAGAYDFVTKPFDPKLLVLSLNRAVQNHRLHSELKRLRKDIASQAVPGFVGHSSAMRRVRELVSRVANSEASVLIQGETGTGKELVARLIHSSSTRQSGPFVAVNCAAVPHALIESELFGHARGAFTDARTQRTGLFLEAHGGTLFLDEIAELPLETQPKLLRALQERTVRPVGSNTETPFDVRVVAATNRDLDYEVFEKRFREDLYYRLNVVTIELPPLRSRGGDVLELAQHLLARFADRAGKPPLTLSPGAAEKLVAYQWPGNVRELENCLERGVALARFDQLTAEDLPDKIRNFHAENFVVAADDPTAVVTLEELEKRYILRRAHPDGRKQVAGCASAGSRPPDALPKACALRQLTLPAFGLRERVATRRTVPQSDRVWPQGGGVAKRSSSLSLGLRQVSDLTRFSRVAPMLLTFGVDVPTGDKTHELVTNGRSVEAGESAAQVEMGEADRRRRAKSRCEEG